MILHFTTRAPGLVMLWILKEKNRKQRQSGSKNSPLSDLKLWSQRAQELPSSRCKKKVQVAVQTRYDLNLNEKNPRVRKKFYPRFWAGNGCANFMGAWEKCTLSAGKTHVLKIPRFRGGIILGFWGGGSADFIFMGARIFLIEPARGNPGPRHLGSVADRGFQGVSHTPTQQVEP